MMSAKKPSIVALIPARSGSNRISHKNIKRLGWHPLIAYTIHTAVECGVFNSVVVSTDSEDYAEVALYYGAEVPFLRPKEFAEEDSPDFGWVNHALNDLKEQNRNFDAFCILRPTSPFRTSRMIRQALFEFKADPDVDSIRAVEECKQHPGKMWVLRGDRIIPVMEGEVNGQPFHSNQYQALPKVFVQNASLEMAWSRVVFEDKSISGKVIKPYFTKHPEDLDINDECDWELAKKLKKELPQLSKEPFSKQNLIIP